MKTQNLFLLFSSKIGFPRRRKSYASIFEREGTETVFCVSERRAPAKEKAFPPPQRRGVEVARKEYFRAENRNGSTAFRKEEQLPWKKARFPLHVAWRHDSAVCEINKDCHKLSEKILSLMKRPLRKNESK
ncbi:hypothetical protein NPIL_561161 [Nephila pilipes]|uniref:Uncharacterized protein n=1 Tax=Nephila pilipes TaxID=299642 RepID=A0A8X6MU82_NEPPI|nr:hypothetical protein NPIL_561161 [Nephila pilipes]